MGTLQLAGVIHMFCYQCQETVGNKACTVKGACGKKGDTSCLQDLLIHLLKGVSFYQLVLSERKLMDRRASEFMLVALFSTVTNVNFDNERFYEYIRKAIQIRDGLSKRAGRGNHTAPDEATWASRSRDEMLRKSGEVGFLSIQDEDRRSLVATIIYGLKGIAAYFHHAAVLGAWDEDIARFMNEALASTIEGRCSQEQLLDIVIRVGEYGVKTMALLDKANTDRYGKPGPTKVRVGVRNRPGILITGHDLRDLEDLLDQTRGSGVDVYTHGEMLPAHCYPFFKRYDNVYGNYGGSWWMQREEFEEFNGPIIVTTNCLVPPKESYKDRIYTTSMVGLPGLKHISDRADGRPKDFSTVIEHAKRCPSPTKLEDGEIVGGFSHFFLEGILDEVIKKVKQGRVSRFYVMAGCDGSHRTRQHYTDFANSLPKDSVILTAGCAKYRYNKLGLGEVDGIPRVLDAGQCNDSYSLALTAIKLAQKLGTDINSLPISYEIAWYEQKAVLVLLSLLYIGVRGINLGPTLPAFVSPTTLRMLEDRLLSKKPEGQWLMRAPAIGG